MSMPAEQIMPTPTLAALLQDYVDAPALPISGIASDSRAVAPGFLFLACQGLTSHGIDYLGAAKAAGAAAVAFDSATADKPADIGIPLFAIEHLDSKLGEIANRFYGYPSQQLGVIGVTGTNGKTTIAWLVAQCMEMLGKHCGYIGTLGHGVGELHGAAGMTTPATIELHGRLAEFVDAHAEFAALEVSSHAIAQWRIDGVRFEAALFSNLSRDHLDYHGDMRSYFESKAQLLLNSGAPHRIVDIDTAWGAELAARCGEGVVAVSTVTDRDAPKSAYLIVRSVAAADGGSDIRFDSAWGDGRLFVPLPGDFNVANAALVLALLLDLGVDKRMACDALAEVSAPPGRMQRVAARGISAYVDYAHTPDAIESALRALRIHCRGRLWCVFGCGGERDTGKRPLMGRAAEQHADKIVITSDNPRHESASSIIDDVVSGLIDATRATIIEDRAAAIAWTIEQAREGDCILIAGKGHESFQLVGGERLPFSDFGLALVLLGEGDEGGAQ
ncbi:MAG: UDP-N-acetylmuramoyl-L-alanyl-D-glutamate--2,6-diaminopimelate ligase [Gammaproteobacteria bacterium]|nr:UDP-N-acetylmuramoyl-L-alanyl-D-glutamate--2,6-diaminopimelate ligase [Gammaproteobacteria bacterium]